MTAAAAMVPGAREPGMLTTFAASPAVVPGVLDGPSTMDAVTVAEHQREGGGAPSQRRPRRARVLSTVPGGRLGAFLVAARLLFARQFRTNHV